VEIRTEDGIYFTVKLQRLGDGLISGEISSLGIWKSHSNPTFQAVRIHEEGNGPKWQLTWKNLNPAKMTPFAPHLNLEKILDDDLKNFLKESIEEILLRLGSLVVVDDKG